jgi:hypothetical protein
LLDDGTVRSFDIRYPVVGSISMAYPGDAIVIADTYFEPIMQGAFAAFHRHPRADRRMPALLLAWQTITGPFDVAGGAHSFDPDDGLLPLLLKLLAGPDRPVLDTSRLVTGDGAAPASIEDVLRAMIDILSGAIARGVQLEVVDLP